MSLRSYGRAFERTVLRPLVRPFRRRDRDARAIAELATRVERLESLFREQAGLQYLRLFDGQTSQAPASAAEAEHPVRTRDSA